MAGKVQAPVARVELRKTQFIRVVARVTLFRVREDDRFDFRRKVQEESTRSSNGSSTSIAVNTNSQCSVRHHTVQESLIAILQVIGIGIAIVTRRSEAKYPAMIMPFVDHITLHPTSDHSEG